MTSGRGAYQAGKRVGSPGSFGQRIVAIRVAWGWTQTALAKALGTTQSRVSEWEKGVAKPAGAAMLALTKLFGLSQAALETGRGFAIPDHPEARPKGSPMTSRAIKELRTVLPALPKGEILEIHPGGEEAHLVSLKQALVALKEAQAKGHAVWLVIDEGRGPRSKD